MLKIVINGLIVSVTNFTSNMAEKMIDKYDKYMGLEMKSQGTSSGVLISDTNRNLIYNIRMIEKDSSNSMFLVLINLSFNSFH